MSLLSSTSHARAPAYAVPEKALRRWVQERLRREDRPRGGTTYVFTLTGSTCNNMPLHVVMTVVVGADGRIEATDSRPAGHDMGCDAMCVAQGDGAEFLHACGGCREVLGLTVAEAAFRDWHAEASGCFCTAGHRRHKWRNVFQALHYAATHTNR